MKLADKPLRLDRRRLKEHLRVKEGSSLAARLERRLDEAEALAFPKTCFRIAYVDGKEDDRVILEGVPFISRVLRVNLEGVHRVFPFVATCGVELETWSQSMPGMLERYWADTILEMALHWAVEHLSEHLASRYRPGPLSRMGPGSLPDWPLEEQRSLFTLLGDEPARIGVRLSESLLMTPIKSISGLFFPTAEPFASCQLCPREKCTGRRAPYDPHLYDQKYLPKKTLDFLSE
jgi:hypothetical protein